MWKERKQIIMKSKFSDEQLIFLYRSFRLIRFKRLFFSNKDNYRFYGRLELRNSLLLLLLTSVGFVSLWLINSLFLSRIYPNRVLDIILIVILLLMILGIYFVDKYLFLKYLDNLEYSESFYDDICIQCDNQR